MSLHLARIGDHHPPDMRVGSPRPLRVALPVASITTSSSCVSVRANAARWSRVMPIRPSRLDRAVVQHHRLGEDAMNVQSNNPHRLASSCCRDPRELAGNTATTDPRSQRIRASRRGGQITARALSPWFKGRPARTHVLPAPHVPDGLTIAPTQRSAERQGTEAIMPDNGKVERFIQTALREWAYAQAYPTSDHRAAELPIWLHRYNWHRPHGSLKSKPPISRLALAEDNLLRLHS